MVRSLVPSSLVFGFLLSGLLAQESSRPNILLITADDLNFDSVGVYGCKVDAITPHIDKLASQGMRFERGHVTIAVCQPCRSVLMTGCYPHRNGALGFQPIDASVATLPGVLRKAGYYNGILGKTRHLAPAAQFAWDVSVPATKLGQGRASKLYFAEVVKFLKAARQRKQPFFLMANSHDPHRPFAGSRQEKRRAKRGKGTYLQATRHYKPAEVTVPGFLPDIPQVRKEVAQYFTSVHRCDETVGEILTALQESGMADNTIVVFISDHGMAFPFAKTNVYFASTKVPWIVRWPGKIRAGSVDDTHFVSGIDFMPSMLEIAGVARGEETMDGRTFVPLLRGEKQDGRGQVLTVFHRTSGKREYPMRCLQNGRFGYIRNAWSDGKMVFRNESQAGLTFRAMKRAGMDDPAIAARVKLFQFRVKEELYDFEKDPNSLNNLADDPHFAKVLARMRGEMLEVLERIGDPELPLFRK
jgi:N-sulfoglucosamine sulfohydrolase